MVLTRSPRIEEAPLQGELMLFDPDSSKFFVLNRTMAFVWRNCDGQRTTGDILEAMTNEFSGVDRETAQADLTGAVEELRSRGLLAS